MSVDADDSNLPKKRILSLRVFGPLSSFLLLFPQRFDRYVLRLSSGVCRTREPSRERSRVRQTPEEGRRTYQPNCCGNNNKDEDNSPKTLNGKNHQASSQKFRQQRKFYLQGKK